MKKINLAITGCLGRMGQQIIKSVKNDKNFKLVAITESKKRDKKINGVKIDINTEQTFKKAHLIIDFTVPNYDFFKKEPPSQAETELVKLINDAKKEKEKNNSLGLAGLLGVTNNI